MRKIAYYFLFLLIFSIPWQNTVAFSGLGTISRLIGLGAIVVALSVVLLYRRVYELPLVLFLMILFIFWNIVSYIWSLDPSATIIRIITYIQLFAMVWLVWELCREEREGLLLIQAFVLGSYVAITDMLLIYTAGIGEEFRIAATGFDQNELATSFAFSIPMAWYLLFKFKSKILYILNICSIPLSIFCIVLTASRGGLIVSLIGLLIIPLTFLIFKVETKHVVAFVLLFLTILYPLLSSDMLMNLEQNIERLVQTTDSIQRGELSNREVIWKAGVVIASENLLIGVGSGGFAKSIEPLVGGKWIAHNTYLALLVDLGIIGLVLFIMIVFISALSIFYASFLDRFFFFVLLLMLLVSFIPLDLQATKITWFILSVFSMNIAFVLRAGNFVCINKGINR